MAGSARQASCTASAIVTLLGRLVADERELVGATPATVRARPRPRPSGPAESRRRVSTSTRAPSLSCAGCSTSATTREAMNRPVRTGVPPRVTSVTSTTPRAVGDLEAPPGRGSP